MKKLVLFAAAGLLTTATIVTATVRSEKKPTIKKEITTKQESKDSKCSRIHHCIF